MDEGVDRGGVWTGGLDRGRECIGVCEWGGTPPIQPLRWAVHMYVRGRGGGIWTDSSCVDRGC